MANETQMQRVVYHIDQGAETMYAADATAAVTRFPDEWSNKPWSVEDSNAARARRKQAHAAAVEDAKAANAPLPPPLPPDPPEPTEAEKAEMSAHAKADRKS